MGSRGSLAALIRAGGGPRRSRGNRADAGPYRKVVTTGFKNGVPWEVYECGHEASAKRDLMGYTNATKRRCWQCKDEDEARRDADRRERES